MAKLGEDLALFCTLPHKISNTDVTLDIRNISCRKSRDVQDLIVSTVNQNCNKRALPFRCHYIPPRRLHVDGLRQNGTALVVVQGLMVQASVAGWADD